MNRQEFMNQLERLLSDVPEAERQDALAYYEDYFDEAGPEQEAQVIQDLGSPGRVAATIKADLKDGGKKQGRIYGERLSGLQIPGTEPDTGQESGRCRENRERRVPEESLAAAQGRTTGAAPAQRNRRMGASDPGNLSDRSHSARRRRRTAGADRRRGGTCSGSGSLGNPHGRRRHFQYCDQRGEARRSSGRRIGWNRCGTSGGSSWDPSGSVFYLAGISDLPPGVPVECGEDSEAFPAWKRRGG